MAIFEPDGKNAIHDGIEHEPGGGKGLLDPTDTVLLLLDHQAGLFQVVKDISVAELRANTTMLAKLATLMKLPVITTASEPNGPNGPLMPEIHESAPHAVFVPRKGEVNAWDNQLFVKSVRETGQKDFDHGRRVDQRLRHVPGTGCESGGVQGLRGYGCFRRPERDGIENDARSFYTSWRGPDERQCGVVRNSPHVEPPRSRRARQVVYHGGAELHGADRELPESTGRDQAAEKVRARHHRCSGECEVP